MYSSKFIRLFHCQSFTLYGIKYVKAKCFEFYECHSSEVKEEWSKCVISIDEKSQALKKIKGKKETENVSIYSFDTIKYDK